VVLVSIMYSKRVEGGQARAAAGRAKPWYVPACPIVLRNCRSRRAAAPGLVVPPAEVLGCAGTAAGGLGAREGRGWWWGSEAPDDPAWDGRECQQQQQLEQSQIRLTGTRRRAAKYLPGTPGLGAHSSRPTEPRVGRAGAPAARRRIIRTEDKRTSVTVASLGSFSPLASLDHLIALCAREPCSTLGQLRDGNPGSS
jgi:hypothetical protein